jgi:hypothetical protein
MNEEGMLRILMRRWAVIGEQKMMPLDQEEVRPE